MGSKGAGKKLLTGIVIVLLLTTSAPLTQAGDGGEPAVAVGEFVRLGSEGELTTDHVSFVDGRLFVDGPWLSSEVHINATYLQDKLSDFVADHAFTLDGDRVVVGTQDVTFTSFVPGQDAVFTHGSEASIQLLDRPMWVSVWDGGPRRIVLDLDDGDPTGQRVRLAKAWLADFDIYAPRAVHEDGTVIHVEETADELGFVLDVPHFSGVAVDDPNEPPTADFSFTPGHPDEGQTVKFTDDSTDDVGIEAWEWNFGDGGTSSAEDPSHTFSDGGTYEVKLTVTDTLGATDTIKKDIIVNHLPVAKWTYDPSSPDELTTIDFVDKSTDIDGSINAHKWWFGDGDGTTSTAASPSHSYADGGSYTVKLRVTDNDNAVDTKTKTITVDQVDPVADFSYTPSTPDTEDAIKFVDASTHPNDPVDSIGAWSWDFGDGSTSNVQNTSHTYATPGTYTVELTVTDDDGMSDTIQRTILVTGTSLDHTWMVDGGVDGLGATLFSYDGDWSGDPFRVNTTVSDVTSQEITFVTIYSHGSIEAVERETYGKVSRESFNRSNFYSPFYINETNLETHQAAIGGDISDLVLVTAEAYVFARGDLSYDFDRIGGQLLGMKEATVNSGMGLTVSATGPAEPTTGTLLETFQAYDLRPLDPQETKDNLTTGNLSLMAFGGSYDLEVQPVSWDADPTPNASAFETVAYHASGVFEDVTPVGGLIVVTESGVSGRLTTDNKTLVLEPLSQYDSETGGGTSVVYDPSFVISRENFAHRVITNETSNSNESESAESHDPGPDRLMALWVDFALTDNITDWDEVVDTAWNTLNDEYEDKLGWSFDKAFTVACKSRACDESYGIETTNDYEVLLKNWSLAIWEDMGEGFSAEIAHLFTGQFDTEGGSVGLGFQPGRYGVTLGRTFSGYGQRDVSITFAHEVGHNFNGQHDGQDTDCPDAKNEEGTMGRARCWWHPHRECLIPPQEYAEELGICLYDYVADWHKHYTLMWSARTDGMHTFFPSDAENLPVGTDKNYEWMRDCNAIGWTSGTYDPTDFPDGFGPTCTD